MRYGLFKNTSDEIVGKVVILGEKLPSQSGATLEIVDKSVFDASTVKQVPNYDPDDLISWAMSQVFVADLIPHMAAFLDFANKATETSKTNFQAYASAVSLTTTANTLINKAVELGANISGV